MTERKKRTVALLSVVATASLTFVKLIAGIYSGSVSVLSEAAHSATDLLAALMAWFAVRQSSKPPDRQHRYGHGKFESLSAGLEALLIWVACYWITKEAIERWRSGIHVSRLEAALAVMGLSLIVNWLVSARLFSVSRQTSSLALEADAWHLRTDAYSSVAVLLGLAALKITGWHWLDPLFALIVVAIMVRVGYCLVKEAIQHLLDTALPPEEEAIVERALQTHSYRFINFHHLRTRRTGAKRNIDLHLVVRDEMTVEEAHQLCDEIEEEIRKGIPDADVTIHVESASSQLQQGIEESKLPYRIFRSPDG